MLTLVVSSFLLMHESCPSRFACTSWACCFGEPCGRELSVAATHPKCWSGLLGKAVPGGPAGAVEGSVSIPSVSYSPRSCAASCPPSGSRVILLWCLIPPTPTYQGSKALQGIDPGKAQGKHLSVWYRLQCFFSPSFLLKSKLVLNLESRIL